MDQHLSRVDMVHLLEAVLNDVIKKYQLGELKNYSFFERGYEDLNIKLETTQGVYVVKIFSKGRSKQFIDTYIRALNEFTHAGIPVSKLYKSEKGQLSQIKGRKNLSYLCVMEYFSGKTFLEQDVMKEDCVAIACFIARMHNLSFPVHGDYDSWGVTNFLKEYSKNKTFLKRDDLEVINPIVDEFASIDFSKWKHSIIHGDFQREHVFKNRKGEYCIIDLGCLNRGVSAFDLGIFLAQFCIDMDPVNEFPDVLSAVVDAYRNVTALSNKETGFLPLIMKAHYCAYLIKTSFLVYGENDKSEQTQYWYDFSRRGLQKFRKV